MNKQGCVFRRILRLVLWLVAITLLLFALQVTVLADVVFSEMLAWYNRR